MGEGMAFGELALILLVVFAVFGSPKLPGAGDLLGRPRDDDEDPTRPRLRRPGRWTLVDWLLLLTTAAIAVTLALACALR